MRTSLNRAKHSQKPTALSCAASSSGGCACACVCVSGQGRAGQNRPPAPPTIVPNLKYAFDAHPHTHTRAHTHTQPQFPVAPLQLVGQLPACSAPHFFMHGDCRFPCPVRRTVRTTPRRSRGASCARARVRARTHATGNVPGCIYAQRLNVVQLGEYTLGACSLGLIMGLMAHELSTRARVNAPNIPRN